MASIPAWRATGSGIGAVLLLTAMVARATDLPGDPDIGYELATEVCAECHLIERGERELYAADPPSFQTMAESHQLTETSLRAFFQTPHRDMPNLMLQDEDIDHLLSYILSLRQGE